MVNDDETVMFIRVEIAKMSVPDREFIDRKAQGLREWLAEDSRHAIAFALVGAEKAAE